MHNKVEYTVKQVPHGVLHLESRDARKWNLKKKKKKKKRMPFVTCHGNVSTHVASEG